MENLLVPHSDMLRTYNDLMSFAGMLVKSGMLPTNLRTPEAAAAIILKGRELGMPMMESFALINVVQGKPTISPQGMIALARRTGLLEDLKIDDDGQTCTVMVTRRGQSPFTTRFSMKDAAAMQLADKDNWKKQPAVMRQWRAISANFRVTFPDVIGGMYTPEELGGDTNTEGEIEPPTKEVASTQAENEPERIVTLPAPAPTNAPAVLDDLLAKFKAAQNGKGVSEERLNKYRQQAALALTKTAIGDDDELRHKFIHEHLANHDEGEAPRSVNGLSDLAAYELAAVRDWAEHHAAKTYLVEWVQQQLEIAATS